MRFGLFHLNVILGGMPFFQIWAKTTKRIFFFFYNVNRYVRHTQHMYLSTFEEHLLEPTNPTVLFIYMYLEEVQFLSEFTQIQRVVSEYFYKMLILLYLMRMRKSNPIIEQWTLSYQGENNGVVELVI